jgi:hypothetical protein
VSDGKGSIPGSHAARAEKLLREERESCAKVSFTHCAFSSIADRFRFRVPVGTTPELQDLLFGLLRRNAKERMPFDVFFNHPFLQRHPPAQQQQAAGENQTTSKLFCNSNPDRSLVAADLPSPFMPSQKPNVAANTAPAPAPPNNNNINNNAKLGK